jgi:hypothetical protein
VDMDCGLVIATMLIGSALLALGGWTRHCPAPVRGSPGALAVSQWAR